MTILDTLITDRSDSDVELYNLLKDKIQQRTATAEEWDLWEATQLKAAYNAHDLNRIASAMDCISKLIADYGYMVKGSPKFDWKEGDIPRTDEIKEFNKAIQSILYNFPPTDSSISPPKSLSNVTIKMANDLEKLFISIPNTLERISFAYEYCGTVFSGEVNI